MKQEQPTSPTGSDRRWHGPKQRATACARRLLIKTKDFLLLRGGWGYLKLLFKTDPTLLDLFLLFTGTVAAVAAGIPFPLLGILFGQLVDDLNSESCNGSRPLDVRSVQESVLRKVLLVIYISIANFCFIYIHTGCWSLLGERLVGRLRRKYFQSLLKQEMAFFEGLPAGEVSARLTNDIEVIRTGTSEKVGIFISTTSYFAGAYIVSFIKVPRLAAMLVFLIPAYILMASVGGHYVGKYTIRMSGHVAAASSIVSQSLCNVPLVFALNANRRLEAKLVGKLGKAQQEGFKRAIASAAQFGLLFLIAYSANALAFWQGSKMIADSVSRAASDVTIGAVYTVIFLLLDASFIVSQVAPFLHIFGSAAASAQSMGKIIDRRSVIDGTSDAGTKPSSIQGQISFEDVSFSYPSRPDTMVLRDVSIVFPARKLTAVVGVSGSGKSTIGVLISRLYDPSKGEILLDGHDVRKLSVAYLRRCIGVINQDTRLLNRSVLENIALGLVSHNQGEYRNALSGPELCELTSAVRNGASFESVLSKQTDIIKTVITMVLRAASDAHADLFIKNLEHGYATVVGSQGNELSGGQKQRILLARALVKDPVILLVDEATSALDSATEQSILARLKTIRENMTTIVIAHRLATVKDAEKIVVMREGEIIEEGTHTELLNSDGPYSALVETQSLQISTLITSDLSGDSTETLAAAVATVEPQTVNVLNANPLDRSDKLDTNLRKRTPSEKKQILMTVQFLGRLTRPQLLVAMIGLFAAIIAGGSYTSEAVIFGHTVGRLGPCEGSSRIRATGRLFGGLFFLLGVIEFTASLIAGSSFGRVSEKLVYRVRILAFRSLFHQDLEWHTAEGRSPASLLSTFTSDTNALSSLSGTTTGTIATISVNLIASIILTHVLAWKIAIVLLATLPILLGAGFMRLRVLSQCQDRHRSLYANSISITIEAVQSIKTVAINVLENDFFQTYCRSLRGPYKASFKEIAFSNLWLATAYSVANLIYALAYWWGAKQVAEGKYTQTDFFIILPALLFSAQSCGQIFALAPDVSNAQSAAARLVDLLRRGSEFPFPLESLGGTGLVPPQNEKDVEKSGSYQEHQLVTFDMKGIHLMLTDIYFRYPSRPHIDVLRGLSLQVNPGEFCALVGASGAGKSTVFALIERFYRPESGTVALDGRDISLFDGPSFRNEISLLEQDSVLFDDTIRFNIALGSRPGYEASDVDIEEACRLANIHDFIASLPEGYETPCGSNIDQFSGGQKQRICLARALVRRPRLLLLDEPTSALDATSETIFQKALESLRRKITIVAIAHRLHTIQTADNIFVIEEGKCVDSGKHEELIQRSPRYRANALHQTLET